MGSGPCEGHGAERGWESRGCPGGGDGDPTAGLGAEERSRNLALSLGRPFSAAGPTEVASFAEHRHLRPSSSERARDTGQRAGQRAASGLRAVLPAYLHGERGPLSGGRLHIALGVFYQVRV